jgi:hypothetical protein
MHSVDLSNSLQSDPGGRSADLLNRNMKVEGCDTTMLNSLGSLIKKVKPGTSVSCKKNRIFISITA